jgi:FkbM family methyltransferase
MIFAVRAHYERELMYLQQFVTPGMVVVDGGANYGIYSVAAARLAGRPGQVLAFEPCSESFSVLRRNIDLNHLLNVRAYCAALSDKNGRARLYHHESGPNSFSLGLPENPLVDSEEVSIRTLDEVLREENIDRVGLIKLDVEGAEELVLRGAARIINHSRPKIIFESHAAAAKQLGLASAGPWDLLKTWGYRFFSLTESGDIRDLNTTPAGDEITNVIAIHDGQYK